MADAKKAAKASAGVKRKGLADADGNDSFKSIPEKKPRAQSEAQKAREAQMSELAREYMEQYAAGKAMEDKPFVGAQPLLLRKPQIATVEETERYTAVACRTLEKLIAAAPGVHVRIGDDAKQSKEARALLEASTDEEGVDDKDTSPLLVSVARDTMHTVPHLEFPPPAPTGKRLLIYIGTPSRYLSMCIKSQRGRFDTAYEQDRLVILCRGVCMLPLGAQEQNIFGVDEDAVFKTICRSLKAKGQICWGHGPNTKAKLLTAMYGYPEHQPMPPTLTHSAKHDDMHTMDYLVDYLKYLNQVQMARPQEPVKNWYDTGLLVSVLTGAAATAGVSILTDSDGLGILRDASIGHIISKLNQMVTVEPYSTSRGVYNFWIGDGACRLNGGVELTMHLIENYKAKSMTTLFIFNNEKWAIEDNLVAGTFEEHHLYNKGFYELLQEHDNVVMCSNDGELCQTMSLLSQRVDKYMKGEMPPSLNIVVIRGCEVNMPPVLGDIEPIKNSSEMAMMCNIFGKFAEGCQHKIPIYGCSAFEYIQYLHIFLEEMPEGKKFQYVCGRTDIQAAHMCGMKQPEGKCILMINDVFGINSIGESVRSILTGFGGKQCLVMIWHPTLIKVIDHFHLHRPPMVWPNLGPELMKYYVRKEPDAVFVDFAGAQNSERVCAKVNTALEEGTPLVCVNVLPEQERAFVSLDIRVKTG
mmetsp:Transcript_53108/g.113411  ORF Transcript_53108/g.113411 Transcript_53108/m.113411 type:complete len:696 (-) Transcript_53108:209-2296(-)